ncbi:protein TolR [Solidesulfovibrio fructosivorans JJ]]|uniref:Protein TolR n=1 Tax=Solidesulfovibrio fructosivorans JJ] TaxID=596151 RepID=E1K0I7_SOLFR|nr:protein TolR [Solidesulfovibrio fructosivorans]EFL49839.1 protein TolR [Solidesulfovibrio fructosivorans JJ]]
MGMQVGGKGRFMADVNVTPFVDVMLVLLIIFMVTAPMMTQGLQVDLPQTRAVSVLPKESDSVVLTIKADGSLYLDKYQVELGDLGGQVQQLVTAQKKQLFLRADKSVPYGTVVAVMGVVKEAGVDKLGVVAEEEKTAAPSPAAKKK